MSTPQWRLTSGPGAVHPVVSSRRLRELGGVALAGLISATLGLAVTIGLPGVSIFLVLGVIAAMLAIVALMVSTRVEMTVALVVLYLGLLDGPAKLLFGGHEFGASIRNVLILSVCAGALMRMVVRRERLRLPPLSGWVLAFVGIALIEVFNPRTEGVLKVFGGFRQQLEWVPFFFFGYYLLRSKRNFRRLFIIVGVMALANGVVAAYQTELTPTALASWGPGYHNLVFVPGPVGTGRTYVSEGETRVRPMALGSDQGFGGGMGVVALTFGLALLATSRRRRWVPILLCLGAIVALITGLNRAPVIGAVLSVAAFAGFATLAGQRVTRVLRTLVVIVLLAVPTGLLVVTSLRHGTFKRYENIINSAGSGEAATYKEGAWSLIPHYLSVAPFGFGLGSVGPVAGLEGRNAQLLEGHAVSSETQFNLIVNELGAPGLVVYIALDIYMLVLITTGMRFVRDGDLALMLAGTLAPFVGLFFENTSGATSNSAVWGPYFWFAVGVAAYWLAGPGRDLARSSLGRSGAQLAPS
ncbi:MAG: hypothetical protein ABSG93_14360 [Solirubrobacteraceae bacterium]|jgi:hypothetical protein